MSVYAGITLHNYRLTRVLGEGGFGVVYEAVHAQLGRKAAVKILHAAYARHDEVVARFFREAQAACAIGHRAIIGITNYGRLDTGEPYIMMDFFEGRSLAGHVGRHGPLALGHVTAVFGPVAGALAAAHAKGVIHRDLKPDNIMIAVEGGEVVDVKLLDFGIAKLSDGGGGGVSTRSGSVMGTPNYMSPEQARDAKSVDARSDVYSFAATVYAALTGRPPFEAEQVPALLIQVVTEPAPRLRAARPDAPAALDEALAACLEKSPEARPPTMEAAWQRMRAALGAAPSADEIVLTSPLAETLPPRRAVPGLAQTVLPGGVAPGHATAPSTTLGGAMGQTGGGAAAASSTRWMPPEVASGAVARLAGRRRRLVVRAFAGVAVVIAVGSAALVLPRLGAGRAPHATRPPADAAPGREVAPPADAAPPTDAAVPADAAPPIEVAPEGMVLVRGGTLQMGRAPYGRPGALDVGVHPVEVADVGIMPAEVTVGEYARFVEAGKAPAPWPKGLRDLAALAALPVVNVAWDDAAAFCHWRFVPGGRLPTEAEWEWAARGPEGRLYPSGNTLDKTCVNGLRGDGGQLTASEVNRCGATPTGILDLSGNAWEWTSSPATLYPGATATLVPDPSLRVIRGGSYYNTDPEELTATARSFSSAPNQYTGFRCVVDVRPR